MRVVREYYCIDGAVTYEHEITGARGNADEFFVGCEAVGSTAGLPPERLFTSRMRRWFTFWPTADLDETSVIDVLQAACAIIDGIAAALMRDNRAEPLAALVQP